MDLKHVVDRAVIKSAYMVSMRMFLCQMMRSDGVQVAAQSGVTSTTARGEKIGGSPAVPIGEFRRQVAVIKSLGRRNKDLEK